MISFISLKLRKSFLIQRANKHPSTIKNFSLSLFHPPFFLHKIILKFFIYFLFKKIIYCFDCAESLLLHRLFSSCREWGVLFSCGARLLIAVAPLVLEHRL